MKCQNDLLMSKRPAAGPRLTSITRFSVALKTDTRTVAVNSGILNANLPRALRVRAGSAARSVESHH